MTITSILVPVDFDLVSLSALEYASELARRLGARIHLLHVLEDRGAAAAWTDDYAPLLAEWRERCHDDAEADLSAIAATLTVPPASAEVVDGSPAEMIVAQAQRRGAELIVMGTHGRRGLSHALVGSVAERVVRTAPCPVLTVRQPEVKPVADDGAAILSITK
jgi:nucleotide-binding universal stress UspA family protein